ncbi:MAG: hypothetical protein JST59_01210 [Actinobacteria bacterium]|nr:hypothetical protein [Actinomycetota bacterium]
MKFPKPREEAAGVKWAIAITDTETNQTADYQVNHGHFRQELTTESSKLRGAIVGVLYEICFWL